MGGESTEPSDLPPPLPLYGPPATELAAMDIGPGGDDQGFCHGSQREPPAGRSANPKLDGADSSPPTWLERDGRPAPSMAANGGVNGGDVSLQEPSTWHHPHAREFPHPPPFGFPPPFPPPHVLPFLGQVLATLAPSPYHPPPNSEGPETSKNLYNSENPKLKNPKKPKNVNSPEGPEAPGIPNTHSPSFYEGWPPPHLPPFPPSSHSFPPPPPIPPPPHHLRPHHHPGHWKHFPHPHMMRPHFQHGPHPPHFFFPHGRPPHPDHPPSPSPSPIPSPSKGEEEAMDSASSHPVPQRYKQPTRGSHLQPSDGEVRASTPPGERVKDEWPRGWPGPPPPPPPPQGFMEGDMLPPFPSPHSHPPPPFPHPSMPPWHAWDMPPPPHETPFPMAPPSFTVPPILSSSMAEHLALYFKTYAEQLEGENGVRQSQESSRMLRNHRGMRNKGKGLWEFRDAEGHGSASESDSVNSSGMKSPRAGGDKGLADRAPQTGPKFSVQDDFRFQSQQGPMPPGMPFTAATTSNFPPSQAYPLNPSASKNPFDTLSSPNEFVQQTMKMEGASESSQPFPAPSSKQQPSKSANVLSTNVDPQLVEFMQRTGLALYTPVLAELWVDMAELLVMSEEEIGSLGLPREAAEKLKVALYREAVYNI